MYSDPQNLTIATVSTPLPRIGVGPNSGTFSLADRTAKFSVSHSYGKRIRRAVRYDFNKFAADPLVSTANVLRTGSVYLVVDQPLQGFSVTELTDKVTTLNLWLQTSAWINTTKLLGGEV